MHVSLEHLSCVNSFTYKNYFVFFLYSLFLKIDHANVHIHNPKIIEKKFPLKLWKRISISLLNPIIFITSRFYVIRASNQLQETQNNRDSMQYAMDKIHLCP
jgi:hypothetical protein